MLNEIKKTRFNILLILVATVISCSKDITTEDRELNQNLDTDDLEVNLEGELQVSDFVWKGFCLLYTSPSPRDVRSSRMPSSA